MRRSDFVAGLQHTSVASRMFPSADDADYTYDGHRGPALARFICARLISTFVLSPTGLLYTGCV